MSWKSGFETNEDEEMNRAVRQEEQELAIEAEFPKGPERDEALERNHLTTAHRERITRLEKALDDDLTPDEAKQINADIAEENKRYHKDLKQINEKYHPTDK